MAKKMTFGEVLDFLGALAPKMTEYVGEDWGLHVMEIRAVLEEMMSDQEILRKEEF